VTDLLAAHGETVGYGTALIAVQPHDTDQTEA
jgi:hypothetical protein